MNARRERRGKRRELAKEANGRTRTIDPNSFEGTYEQRRRRRLVYVLRLANYTIREMATELKVDKGTILRDLNAIDSALQKQIDPLNATAIINEGLEDYEAVRLLALEELESASVHLRNGYLNTIVNVTELKIRLLQDAGILPKARRKLEMTGANGMPLPQGPIAPVIHVVMEQTEETKRIKEQYNILPD